MLTKLETLAQIRAMTATVNAHDATAAALFYAPAAIWAWEEGMQMDGRSEIENYWRELYEAIPDVRLDIRSLSVPAPGKVVVEYTWSGTNTGPMRLPTGVKVPPTGRRFALLPCAILTLNEEGQIVRQYVARDTSDLLAQRGMVPAKSISGEQVAERLLAAINQRDAAGVGACYLEDAVHTVSGQEYRGRAAVERAYQLLFTAYPDLQITGDEILADGARITIPWTIRGTNTGATPFGPATGKTVEFRGIFTGQVGFAGALTTGYLYYHPLSEWAQLGLIRFPSKG